MPALQSVGKVSVLAGACLPALAHAHAFDDRYLLPGPLRHFVLGAAAVVALSFLVIALANWWKPGPAPSTKPDSRWCISLGPVLPLLGYLLRPLSVLVLCVTIGAAVAGTGNPMMNLAPTLVWIVWWIGGSLLIPLTGNFWPVVDPWQALHRGMDVIARRLGRTGGATFGLPWPDALGEWPAVALLLLWGTCEVVFPLAAVPYRIGAAALAWTTFTLAGMICFGRETWQRHVDPFAIYFNLLGRFAPLAAGEDGRSLQLRPYGSALVRGVSPALAGFVIAMLAIVLFDGVLAGDRWAEFEPWLRGRFPGVMDANGYLAGSLGMLCVWAVFLLAFLLVCAITTRLVPGEGTWAIAGAIAPSFVPIAFAYCMAHNFASFVTQGQNLLPLLSDPLGAGWNLLGTAGYRPNPSTIDAATSWYVAIGAITVGHIIAIGLAHRVALRLWRDPRRALLASLPLTLLMVAYTALSLLVIAEPMVRSDAALIAPAGLPR